ncbi:unnamed protein product [Mytilus coruscus]|uniref:CUB domain-containing protein n=1 Tax=Mytilus coruscus TaxID=42192 RepID=A0A6J8DP73_MYTCO|nr:unnamed protein product [Mytilus coruscus]
MEIRFVYILILLSLIQISKGSIVVQSNDYCSVCSEDYCRNTQYYKTKYSFAQDDYDTVQSQSGNNYYKDGQNCIVYIKAKPSHQIEVLLTSLDVDSHGEFDSAGYPTKCYDFLKLFNGPRVDNARLLPKVPASGICGSIYLDGDLANLRSFRTTQNELTIQFVTDNRRDNKAGFLLRITQIYYSNPNNLYPEGVNPGGWNDGTFNEFQNKWDEQDVIPGGIIPGGGNEYDKETGGVSCYTCNTCNKEPFDAEAYGIGTKSGCYMCVKAWDDAFSTASRKCFTQSDYIYTLEVYEADRYIGCKQFVNSFQRTVNYCFCNTNNCNSAAKTLFSPFVMVFSLVVSSFFIIYDSVNSFWESLKRKLTNNFKKKVKL